MKISQRSVYVFVCPLS